MKFICDTQKNSRFDVENTPKKILGEPFALYFFGIVTIW